MSISAKSSLWITIFILFVTTPILILIVGMHPEGREFWRELSVALGFAGLTLIGFQFIPTARIPYFGNIFPMDTLYSFHHKISIAGFILALAHPLLLFVGNPYTISLLNLFDAPWRARAAVVAVILLFLLIISSVWRMEIGLHYERWRFLHEILSIGIAALALYHIFMVNYYMANPFQRAYWYFSAGLWTLAMLYTRVFRPIQLLRKPYRVVAVKSRRSKVWTLILEPDGHEGLDFKAGQFAWITYRTSPFSFRDNPFSFDSSAAIQEEISFTIQEAGDHTSMIPDLKPGEKVYVDGPYGTFYISRYQLRGYVLIGGGIGSVPLMSMIRTVQDRQENIPLWLFYGNKNWENVVYREELEALKKISDLKVIHVLEEPGDSWRGESGFINAEVLRRHLPENYKDMQYMICGPIPMNNAVEKELAKMQIPQGNIHAEHFEMA